MPYIQMILMLLMVAAGQILLKKGIAAGQKRGKGRIFILFHPLVLVSAVLVALSPFLYVSVVGRMGLTAAFGLNALNYPLIFILSRVFLKEKSNPWHWSGLILISAGVFVWSH